MKNLFFLCLLFVFVGLSYESVHAQQPGTVVTAIDTSKSATAVNIPLVTTFKGTNVLTIQALCTQIGGTSEGKVYVQGSVDGTSYTTLTDQEGVFKGFGNDTLNMTNGAIGTWVIFGTPWQKYRIQATGGASDTTKITVKYHWK